jgi:hypothetical protein
LHIEAGTLNINSIGDAGFNLGKHVDVSNDPSPEFVVGHFDKVWASQFSKWFSPSSVHQSNTLPGP